MIEKTILECLTTNEPYARKVLPFLKREYFHDNTERTLFGVIDEYIKKYNGETVTIMGYMFPLEESEKQRKFLIGPYPLSCPFHYHVGPSQVIEIKSDNPVDFSFDPITIKGKLKIKFNEETGSFFYLETIKS